MKAPKLNTVLIDVNRNTCAITLNRPEKKNALNDKLVEELKIAFNWANSNNIVRIVVLNSVGDVFCSGADLSHLQKLKDFNYEENLEDSKALADLFLKIYNSAKPVIAAVKGPALAGGCGLAGVCDFIIAGPKARFGYPEVKIGFVAALVSALLIRQVGERRARDLLLSGKIINSKEAKKIGLISTSCETEEAFNTEVNTLIETLLHNSSQAMSSTKNLFNNFIFQDIVKEFEKLTVTNAHLRKNRDFNEGVSAFLEKRKPNWDTN